MSVFSPSSSFLKLIHYNVGARVLGVLLPTITLLLASNGAGTQALSASIPTQATAQLLTYATASPAGFKEAAGKLDPATRELLETSIRRAVGGAQGTQAQQVVKPQISLRSF